MWLLVIVMNWRDLRKKFWIFAKLRGRKFPLFMEKILEEEMPNEDLESRTNRSEDTIYEIKDLCDKMIWQAKDKPAFSSIKIPVDMDEASITLSPPKLSLFNDPSTSEREPSESMLVGLQLTKINPDKPSTSTQTGSMPFLNPCASPYQPVDHHTRVRPMFSNIRSKHGARPGVETMLGATFPPPGLRLELEKFDGDVMKFWDFKKKFKRHVEEVNSSHENRLAFLKSMCVGRTWDVVAGLSCLVCSEEAYARAWEKLEKRFGEMSNLMNRQCQELLDGPSIKEGDAEAMLRLSDKMYRYEISFQGWKKGWMLNSRDLMHSLFELLPYRMKSQFVG